MHRRSRDVVATNQFVLVVDADVVLVSIVIDEVLLGPARIRVLLSENSVRLAFPILRSLSFLDRRVLLARVTLARRRDKAGIHDLSFAGDETRFVNLLYQQIKQLHQLLLLESLSEQAHCTGVRHLPLGTQTQKAAERITIAYLIFNLFVREVVQMLQHQDFEHQHLIVGFSTSIALALYHVYDAQQRPEGL